MNGPVTSKRVPGSKDVKTRTISMTSDLFEQHIVHGPELGNYFEPEEREDRPEHKGILRLQDGEWKIRVVGEPPDVHEINRG